jgi:hypothetical protein
VAVRVHGLADNRALITLTKCRLFLPSPIHACPCHGPWAKSQTAKTCRDAKRVPDAIVGAGQLRETTPTKKHRSSSTVGDWAWGCQPRKKKKNIATKSKEVRPS